MESDTALLAQVADGARPGLRLYRWGTPALSLGRFQSDDEVDHDACRRLGVEVVRRPTGGKALLHGADLTYAVAIPRPEGADGSVDAVYCRLAGALIAGLARLGVDAAIARHDRAGRMGEAARLPGRCASRACRAPTCGSGTASCAARRRCGVGERCSSTARSSSSACPSTRPRCWCPGVAAPCPRPTICAGSPSRWRSSERPATPRWWLDALVEGFRETLDVEFT